MNPELLKLLTDPEARKDPEKLRAFSRSIGAETRRSVIGSARTNGIVMGVLGYLLLAASFVVIALVVFPPFVAPSLFELPAEAMFVALLLDVIGGLFVVLARSTAMPSASLLRNGVRGRATVREVKALGRALGIRKPGITATLSRVTLLFHVEPEGQPPFDLEHSEFILSSDLTHLEVGSTVPIRHARSNPQRMAIDWDSI
jgi:hypothetical protein